jgi:hypothetical protein
MFLLLSGEGASDIGTQNDEIGPMTKFVDNWIKCRSDYSFVELGHYTIISETQIGIVAKDIKPRSRKGKKQLSETRYFYSNARALAIIAKLESNKLGVPIIPILFRDADKPSHRGEWANKRQSMLDGFEIEEVVNGVPMIPKPTSEAWVLCALRNNYQNCEKLENESSNPNSPNPLKQQLEQHLGESGTRAVLNDKIDYGELDINKIVDMPSLSVFKERLDEVLDNLGLRRVQYR